MPFLWQGATREASQLIERLGFGEKVLCASTTGCSTESEGIHCHRQRFSPFKLGRRTQQRNMERLAAVAIPSEVKIVTKDSLRIKRILAEMQVRASVDQVWRVLTDYNHLADFVPNLESCERTSGAPPGRQRLKQRACSQSLYWRLQAEAVLDVQEIQRPLGRRELHFSMVAGDFKEFSGRWILDPDPSVQDGLSLATILRYEVSIVPKWSLPSTLITTVVRCGLPANVRAIALRAEKIAEMKRMAPKFAKAGLAEEAAPLTRGVNAQPQQPSMLETLPAKGPPRAGILPNLQVLLSASLGSRDRAPKSEQGKQYLGLNSVPLPFPVPRQQKARWEKVEPRKAAAKRRQALQASYPSFNAEETLGEGPVEVHLRRLDDPLTLHRRTVASVVIEASPEEVWRVLTDYEKLPEFVPNLAVSERLETPAGAPERLIRLRQVGFKTMVYMHLHAEATLALVESPCREIQFRQLSGDFQLLQGKFILEDATPQQLRQWGARESTTLKYAVEVEIPRTTALLGLLEPLLERVVYEDIPSNLEAIKQRVESFKAAAQLPDSTEGSSPNALAAEPAELPARSQLAEDFPALQRELERCFGPSGPLPKGSALEKLGRTDIVEVLLGFPPADEASRGGGGWERGRAGEQAIEEHGGAELVGRRMGWRQQRPKSARSDLETLRRELEAVALEEGLPPGVLPSLQMLKAGHRKELLLSAKLWGGLEGLAELFELESAEGRAVERQTSSEDVDALLRAKKPSRGEMVANFEVMAKELRKTFGESGPLPSTTELRKKRRHDLEVAVAHHGGAQQVSKQLGWGRGYSVPNSWESLELCKAALDKFCVDEGLPLRVVPLASLMQQAKRYDLLYAVRQWGGLYKLADALGYQVASSQLPKNGRLSPQPDSQRAAVPGQQPGKSVRRSLRDEIDSW